MPFDFDTTLTRYADLAVQVGLNLQAGQRLLILAPLPAAPLVRKVAAAAYIRGARLVDVLWQDDELQLIRFQKAPRDSFTEFWAWHVAALAETVENGHALLSLRGTDPDLLRDQDPKLVSTARRTTAVQLKHINEQIGRDAINWTILGVPVPAWAAKVFPDLPPGQQQAKLWEAIWEVCRLDRDDPIAAWQTHIAALAARARLLNAKRYNAIHLRGPGADLTIGLPHGHLWQSARAPTANGLLFTANLPTEEVFTLPDRNRTEGRVTASMPLNLAGSLIEDFSLTFSGGRVVDLQAARGEALLRDLIETDEGAAHLGELALVPHSSPIGQTGLLFYNTLFDENAASHIALGRGININLQGGQAMSDEEFAAAGGNRSLIHVDFMIGSGQMDVDGLSAGGAAEPLMRRGEWTTAV